MLRSQLPPGRADATFALLRWKLGYVANPKAACTATKWLLADVAGVDPRSFYRSLSRETSRSTTIHNRRRAWGRDVPQLADLDDQRLAAISPDNGWFVFSTTRHPAARLWSAWQSKLLLHEPRFYAEFAGAPWLPRIPQSTDDVVEDWLRFIDAVASDPDLDIMREVHFRPQHAVLNVPKLPYDRLYDTSEFRAMLGDLERHLTGLGWRGTLRPRRHNETPLPPLRRAFPSHVVDAIAARYADDFELLGYDDPKPPRLSDADYSDDLIAATAIIAERGERIGDISPRALAARGLQRLRRVGTRR
jgi:hypothetical protein